MPSLLRLLSPHLKADISFPDAWEFKVSLILISHLNASFSTVTLCVLSSLTLLRLS